MWSVFQLTCPLTSPSTFIPLTSVFSIGFLCISGLKWNIDIISCAEGRESLLQGNKQVSMRPTPSLPHIAVSRKNTMINSMINQLTSKSRRQIIICSASTKCSDQLFICKAVIKTSSCWVNDTSRRGIKQLGYCLVVYFLYFPTKVCGRSVHTSRGKSLAPGS